ncbi:HAMP domain-containing sensor histidine kinase [Ramlibacter sp.]|uniref:sensor histidine kinase n=1 Tax=Ramlibacter sp. TaxID=1917967 RepID=UPI002CD698E0|nr:HAMP domain-containing sensor histidine kinase [Ramlibacter sp.]HWI84529.1 HAMP domain-containing sensor histidine kinase [Ramlibacter sp.]
MRPLVEPILHPSRWRIRALGLTTTFGHPLFYWAWAKLLPQPYESLFLRILMSVLGISLLVFPAITATPPRKAAVVVFTAIFWVTLPLFFSWMYFCNSGNQVWLASFGAMFLIYYHVTDWRIATIGSASGVLVAWLAFEAFGPATPAWSFVHVASNTLVLAFCWIMGVILAISSSNLRREQLNYTLATMGIMAHELRTPLATVSLIGDAVRNEAPHCGPEGAAALEKLAGRLYATVRNMNHQIDTQIANARLTRLPAHHDTVSAAELVREAVAGYPYRTTRERECVAVEVQQDFQFRGSRALFLQVVDNLVKNALRSLAAAEHASRPGDLRLEVRTSGGRGQIVVQDRGVGMDTRLKALIFTPFFSTDRGTGHGLGLAFCQRVVESADGSIHVQSELTQGARFTIELPVLGAGT